LVGCNLTVVTEIFPNFAAARAKCGPGYNDAEIADVVAFKTGLPFDNLQVAPEQAVNSILAVGLAASEFTDRPLTVLDFGGGCGFHYFRVAAAVHAPLRWAIVETLTMAERAIKLAQGRFDVFVDIAGAAQALGQIDLVHTSGAIHYVPDPLATLSALVALRPRYFVLARFPSWGRASIVSVQVAPLAENAIGAMPPSVADRAVHFPVTFTSFHDVLQVFQDYEIVLAIASPSADYEFRGQRVPGRTIVFRAKD
jgi:putative methyltransferase (TIGR04325 family)